MKRYAEWIVRQRFLVIVLTLLVTMILGLQIKNLKVIIDPSANLPQDHPYVITTNQVEKLFASKNVVIIGITSRAGDALQTHVLKTVQRITTDLLNMPDAIRNNILSLSSRRAKKIMGTSDWIEVRPFMENVPQTPQEIQVLRQAVYANPIFDNVILSKDERTAAIVVELTDPDKGYRAVMERIQAIVDYTRDSSVEIAIGGWPVYGAQLERYSDRMVFLFPIAVLIIGLIHYEAFRSVQGLILPLVTALLAVIWGLGIMGLRGVPMDAFNAATPILILAVAAGHAVQVLKRYYEEYRHPLIVTEISLRKANQAAVVASITWIGPVMLAAGLAAALAFFSLLIFNLAVIRTFGLFTGLGIVSALILEMTFIPAVRSLLPAPQLREQDREREWRVWDRITETIAAWVTGGGRRYIYAGSVVFLVLCVAGALRLTVDDTVKSYFFQDLPFQVDDRILNARLAGTETLYLLVQGRGEGAIKDPIVLKAMEATQQYLEQQPYVGKTASLADFIKRMHLAMHGDDPAYDRIPEDRELIAQYLLLYSMLGASGDLTSYVDSSYGSANIWVFLKTYSTAHVDELITKLTAYLPVQFEDHVRVTIGGSAATSSALNEVMVYSKILNIIQIAGVILLIVSVLFRSVVAGFLVLVPLSLAVLGNLGLMGLIGIRLNTATAVISAMAVGIGADYAIYLIYRLREELAHSVDETIAFRTAVTTAGKAILFVASAIAGGYGVLLLSWGFSVHIWFGLLTATAMLVSSLSAITILPSLILTFRPRFVFSQAHRRLSPLPTTTVTALFFLGSLLLAPSAQGAELTTRAMMERNALSTKVLDSTSKATFILIDKSGQERVRKTVAATKLQLNGIDETQMVRFIFPHDVKGTSILLMEHFDKEDGIWVYLPTLKKVRRLVASHKKESFLGTDFSYGDVIGHKVEEWEHHLIKEEVVDGRACYVVESLPNNETVMSNSGYSKRFSWIQKDNFVTIKGEFWDQAGQRLKTTTFADVQLVDSARGKWHPMQMEATNHQTGHRTRILIENFNANQGAKDEFFAIRYLEREP